MSNQDTDPKPSLGIGHGGDNERTQIITDRGWHVAYIEYDPHEELAAYIVAAGNEQRRKDARKLEEAK